MRGGEVDERETARRQGVDLPRSREQEFHDLSERILRYGNRGGPRIDFLREVSGLLLDSSGADALELRLTHEDLHYRWTCTRGPDVDFTFAVVPGPHPPWSDPSGWQNGDDGFERLCHVVVDGRLRSPHRGFTKAGSFLTGNTTATMLLPGQLVESEHDRPVTIGGPFRSLAMIAFAVDEWTMGLLQFKSRRPDFFTPTQVEFLEAVARTLGLAIADRRAQAALRERIKELTCLYGLALVVARAGLSLEAVLQEAVELLPPAWQFPDAACAQITLDGQSYRTRRFLDALHVQTAPIAVGQDVRGAVEVRYFRPRPEFAEGPFLKEERNLINAVAAQLGLQVERRQADLERSRLRQQLQHADRLATIGQLAAGVAHELNEPLSDILGFAQLAKKSPELPPQIGLDLENIIKGSLHAREIIKKLMLFARQSPTKKQPIQLNTVVGEALYFLAARCAKAGIKVEKHLAGALPELPADPTQINQIVVNLVVNALQAMPMGGVLTIETRQEGDMLCLSVQDTGVGMSEEVQSKLFIPFFTTKEIDQGTGLGLSVVHGIVAAHQGSIQVESAPGKGARFEVRLPCHAEPEHGGT